MGSPLTVSGLRKIVGQSDRSITTAESDRMWEALLEQRDSVAALFETVKGSRYVVLESGEALRIKRWQDGEKCNKTDPGTFVVTRIRNHIFFVSSGHMPAIQGLIRGYYLGFRVIINTTDYAPGIHPLDITTTNDNEHCLSISENSIEVDPFKVENGGSKPDVHLGDIITNIVK